MNYWEQIKETITDNNTEINKIDLTMEIRIWLDILQQKIIVTWFHKNKVFHSSRWTNFTEEEFWMNVPVLR
jgi:hypothetical protein